MPETLRLWQELSGLKVREFCVEGDGFAVNGRYFIQQKGGEIHVSVRTNQRGAPTPIRFDASGTPEARQQ